MSSSNDVIVVLFIPKEVTYPVWLGQIADVHQAEGPLETLAAVNDILDRIRDSEGDDDQPALHLLAVDILDPDFLRHVLRQIDFRTQYEDLPEIRLARPLTLGEESIIPPAWSRTYAGLNTLPESLLQQLAVGEQQQRASETEMVKDLDPKMEDSKGKKEALTGDTAREMGVHRTLPRSSDLEMAARFSPDEEEGEDIDD